MRTFLVLIGGAVAAIVIIAVIGAETGFFPGSRILRELPAAAALSQHPPDPGVLYARAAIVPPQYARAAIVPPQINVWGKGAFFLFLGGFHLAVFVIGGLFIGLVWWLLSVIFERPKNEP